MRPGDLIRWHPNHIYGVAASTLPPTPVIAVVTDPDGAELVLMKNVHNGGYHALVHAQFLQLVTPQRCCPHPAIHLARNIVAGTALGALAAIDQAWILIRKLR